MSFPRNNIWNAKILSLALAACVAVVAILPAFAGSQPLSFKIPPVRTSVNIENQPIAITASGLISQVKAERGENVFKLELLADLSDLQRNITGMLQAQLDKSDRCADRIAIQHATLTPMAPAAQVVSQFHFERWTCTKVFGKEHPNKLVGGNAVIEVKLTPAVEQDSTLKLVPEIGRIDADGPLGEMLRSGALGAALRKKITETLLSAMQKGTNFKATLPPVVQDYASIQNAQFQDGGTGNLDVVMDGEIHITNEQIKLLTDQLKERLTEQGIR